MCSDKHLAFFGVQPCHFVCLTRDLKTFLSEALIVIIAIIPSDLYWNSQYVDICQIGIRYVLLQKLKSINKWNGKICADNLFKNTYTLTVLINRGKNTGHVCKKIMSVRAVNGYC